MPKLVFHTFYGEFSGNSPEEIVQQLYENTKKAQGPSFTMREWWDYQRKVWKIKAGKNLPATLDEPGAAEAFIAFLVEVEGLEEGPSPE